MCGVGGSGVGFVAEKIELRPVFGNVEKSISLCYLAGFQDSKNPIILSLHFKMQSQA